MYYNNYMNVVYDFSNCRISNVHYGGSEKKLGIIFNNEKYMLKFQKKSPFGSRFNHISEYLGSHIFEQLGFDVHKTILGLYKGNEVVACKDFVGESELFVPFNDVGESTIDTDINAHQYSYEEIIKLINSNKKLTNVDECLSSFFEIFIVDALIGNFDRHGSNWGFIKENNKYRLAPVFDNGSSLYPQMIDEEEIIRIMNDEGEINRRIYEFPTSQIKINGNKSSYFDVISSLNFPECNDALLKIYPKIDLEIINKLIDNTPFLSEVHKTFYKVMIEQRYVKILKYSYELLGEKTK